MANPSIRGHRGQIKFFRDGENVEIVNVTSVDVNQDSDFSRSSYVGQALMEGDQVQNGWSGSLEAEVKDSGVDDFIDALVTQNLNGVGISDYSFTITEEYVDGTRRTYVYFDVQFKMSRRQAGSSDKITKRLEFQASGRSRL